MQNHSARVNNLPDSRGRFGQFGGRFVAETLMPALFELEKAYKLARRDPKFRDDLARYSREYVGRPTPLFYCANLTAKLGGAKIYLKREDLCHTGAHKVNNTLGQALLAERMGKSRITAETERGSMGWQRRRWRRCSNANAKSSWAASMSSGSR